MEVSVPKPILLPRPADRRDALEAIATVLRGEPLTDPATDLISWVVSAEVMHALERAGFQVARNAAAPVCTGQGSTPDAGEAAL